MAEIVRMPKLSDTMTEGTVAKWLKKVGEKVKSGEILAEIDSDKATMEFESFYDGVLLYIGVQEKQAAPVDVILAIIGKEGEDISKIIEEEKKKGGLTPALSALGGERERKSSEKTKTEKIAVERNVEPVVSTFNLKPETSNFIKSSPLAKKLAKEKGVILNKLKGSGDGGRVVKRDIELFQHYGTDSYREMKEVVSTESFTEESVSQMRKTIAKRLTESKFTSPHFYLTMEIDMDECVKARETINGVNPTKISYNDFVIKASAAALRQHPKVNASWLDNPEGPGTVKIRYNKHIHIGVAVAVEEGLLVPVVKFADAKTLSQIATEVKLFAQKAKEKKLQPPDWEGNTFTISNLGMFGIDEFTAIINPPDACILAVGGIKQTPVVKEGLIVPGYVMKVTLSCDHRVVDGSMGAMFLQTFKHLMENPVLLLGAQNI